MTQIKKEKAPHPAHQVYDEVPADKTMVRLYNRGEGSIKHDIKIEDGSTVAFEIKGQSFARVPKEVADLWLSMFEGRIVTDNEAQKLIAGVQAESDRLKAELAKANEQLAAARAKSDPKGELARVNAELAALKDKNAALTADLEKATAPAAEGGSPGI